MWKGTEGPADRFASVDDYLVFCLTGQWATNPSNAAGMQLMEVSTRDLESTSCAAFAGIDPSGALTNPGVRHFPQGRAEPARPPPRWAWTPAPRWWWAATTRPAPRWGLVSVDPGDLFLSAGTAWVLTLVTDQG